MHHRYDRLDPAVLRSRAKAARISIIVNHMEIAAEPFGVATDRKVS
jgi:hypothetical protein